MSLSIQNVNATTWDTQGEMGYWVGVGFGTTAMAGSDIVLCQFKHTGNNAVDKFLCSDRKATARALPAEDPLDNVDDINTAITYTTVGGVKYAALTA